MVHVSKPNQSVCATLSQYKVEDWAQRNVKFEHMWVTKQKRAEAEVTSTPMELQTAAIFGLCVSESGLAKWASMRWDHKASRGVCVCVCVCVHVCVCTPVCGRIQLSLYFSVSVCVYLWLPHQHAKVQRDTHTQWALSITYHTGHTHTHTHTHRHTHTHTLWTSCTEKHANRRLLFGLWMTV